MLFIRTRGFFPIFFPFYPAFSQCRSCTCSTPLATASPVIVFLLGQQIHLLPPFLNLPVQELNLRTVLFRPVCSWGSPWAKNWDEGPFNLHFTLAGDEKSRSANAHNSMSTLFPEIWPKFCHLPAPAALCGCTSFIPPAPSAETKGRAAPHCFLQLYSKLGLPWSCKEMVPFVPYTLILWGCRGKELREEEVFYRQQKSSRSCLSKFRSGPELPNLMCDPKL